MVKKVSIIALAALLLGGCQPPRVRPSLTAQGQTEFQHDVHLALKGEDGKPVSLFCDACHAVQPKDGYAVLRPGSAQHAPCNTCHADEYKKPPGPFCGVCHESVNPKAKGDSPLLPYPGSQRGAQLVSRFDHAVHLDASSKKTALECGACHVVESETSPYMGFPRHQACAGCHAKEDGERAQPEMSECGRCHDRESPVRPKNFLENDIRFTHAKHKVDRSGAEIMCTTCHAAVTQSASEASLQLPEMKDCANCHEDAARTPDEVRIEKCQVCHLDHVDAVVRPGSHTAQLPVAGWGDEGMLARLAPALLLPLDRGLTLTQLQGARAGASVMAEVGTEPAVQERPLPSTRRPDDHNAFFRKRHAAAAESDNAKCRYCHVGVSGSPVSSCQDCHAVMRPRNHTGRFSTTRHGRLAALDTKACATCHEIDYCTSCHNIPPPSHLPLERFRLRHSRRASANGRACVTCHTFQSTCARCHASDVGTGSP